MEVFPVASASPLEALRFFVDDSPAIDRRNGLDVGNCRIDLQILDARHQPSTPSASPSAPSV
jgi:hypothetical protein